jgi:hypothetical protein
MWVLGDWIEEKRLWGATYRDPAGVTHQVDLWFVFKYTAFYQQYLWGMTLLAFVMGFVLFGFFAYHLCLILVNTTTNERAKRSEYHYERNRLLAMKKAMEEKTGKEVVFQKRSPTEPSGELHLEGEGPQGEPQAKKHPVIALLPSQLIALTPSQIDCNQYYKGVLANFAEVLFPIYAKSPRASTSPPPAAAKMEESLSPAVLSKRKKKQNR